MGTKEACKIKLVTNKRHSAFDAKQMGRTKYQKKLYHPQHSKIH